MATKKFITKKSTIKNEAFDEVSEMDSIVSEYREKSSHILALQETIGQLNIDLMVLDGRAQQLIRQFPHLQQKLDEIKGVKR